MTWQALLNIIFYKLLFYMYIIRINGCRWTWWDPSLHYFFKGIGHSDQRAFSPGTPDEG
jgi:hypothetical protein